LSEYEVTEVSIAASSETWKPKLIREGDDVIRASSGPEWECDSAVVVKVGVQSKKTSEKKTMNETSTVKCSY
jgi:hypothetical protein